MSRLIVPLLVLGPTLLLAARPGAPGREWGGNATPPHSPPGLSGPGTTAHPPAIKALGVASCAAAACHNANGPLCPRGSEYSAWSAVDPHTRAYQVLFCDESRRMHEMLARANPALQACQGAHENPLCLRCHGMGDCAPPVLHADGVGCERCHGPAEKWINTHYLPGFDRKTPGFIDLRNNLVTRTRLCTECHVGRPGTEVDHDLIAAGHPRLRFEYAGYYASYPRHWCDREVHDTQIEVRSWVIGQLSTAHAALELLAARADEKRASWPEFAEYSCAACHHGLKKDSPLRIRDLTRAEMGLKPRLGELPWGTWYHALLPALAKALPGEPAKQRALAEALARLDHDMRRRVPPVGRVREEATAAAQLVDAWLCGLETRRFTAADIRALMAVLASQDGLVAKGWDGGTQVYLALASLHQALGNAEPGFRDRSPLRDPLLRLRQALADSFPRGPTVRPRYDSPADYRPEPLLEGLDAFRKRLQ